MNRESVLEEITNINTQRLLIEIPTGYGKTLCALRRMAKLLPNPKVLYKEANEPWILIVCPTLVIIEGWKQEIHKWGYDDYLPYIQFVTYISFPKMKHHWDLIIFDEAHHFSERCAKAIDKFSVNYFTLLSATMSKVVKERFNNTFPITQTYSITPKEAIDNEVLPDPTVYLLPIKLDNKKVDHFIIKNKTKGDPKVVPYSLRFRYAKVKNRMIKIACTQQQFYDEMSSKIAWFKKMMLSHRDDPKFEQMFLRASKDRINWLSDEKTELVKYLLEEKLINMRTLTFCNSITQTNELGRYRINSKDKSSSTNLAKFNKGLIKHITACNVLDEGVNLTNCQVGVYAVLNSSDRMIIQKLGRLLRHPKPILIIPYFQNTRDEEIVEKMKENYNPKLIKVLNKF